MLCKRLLKMSVVSFLLLLTTNLFAQTRTITGTVTDSKDGSPIAGASVQVKGSAAGTSTGGSGEFSLTIPQNANTLVVTNIGFVTQEVAIGGLSSVNVSLVSSTQGLSEVVVVGYGSRRVKDLTGSVAQVTTKDFNKGQISTPEQLLQGRTPGVSITPSSGEPGAASTINIRGTYAIRGNQQPLYVVDGVPIVVGGTTSAMSTVDGGTTAKNPLMFLNPNDIESMTILKDASSAAIYGVRGANGVILITTKSGKSGKPVLDFGANWTYSAAAKRYDLMNAKQFLDAVGRAKQIMAGAEKKVYQQNI